MRHYINFSLRSGGWRFFDDLDDECAYRELPGAHADVPRTSPRSGKRADPYVLVYVASDPYAGPPPGGDGGGMQVPV